MNPLDSYDDVDLFNRFRMPRQCIMQIIDLIFEDIEPSTLRFHAIPATLQTLCALRYYATGNFQTVSGDVIGISQPSVSRIVDRVTRAICRKAPQIIKFPRTEDEQVRCIQRFFEKTRFPGTIGAVDGSLVRIKAPSIEENIYVCRKGYHALNIQGICDGGKRFTNIVSRFAGSTHDAFIWNGCSVNREFERGNIQGHLLGDSGYPLRPWLLTPVLHARNEDEERYNRRHRQARQLIESTLGKWKLRWLVVHDYGGAITLSPERCCRIVVATAVLHNICEEQGIPLPPNAREIAEEHHMMNDDLNPPPMDQVNDGRRYRDAFIRGHFAV
jgi:hypothetical protein